MPDPKITVITVTYQAESCIDETLTSMQPSFEKGIINSIVVDNASMDNTVDLIQKKHPWVTLIKNKDNVGFGRANNIGFNESTTPYVLFLNPDAVIDSESILTLSDFLDNTPKAGIVAPAIIEPDGNLQPSFLFPKPSRLLMEACGLDRFYKRLTFIEPGSVPSLVDWVGGAVFMIRKSVFEQLKGFDPRFFLYFEETDLCLRTHQAGWEIWTTGKSVAKHANAACAKTLEKKMTADCISDFFFPSRLYYLQKHHGKIAANLTELGELVLLFPYSLFGWIFNRSFKRNFADRLSAPLFKLPKKF